MLPREYSCVIVVDETTDEDVTNATSATASKRAAGEEASSAQTKRVRRGGLLRTDAAGVTMPPEDQPYVLVTQRSPRQRIKPLKIRERFVHLLVFRLVLTAFQ